MNGEKLGEMVTFKYLGATLSKDGTITTEVRIRIVNANAAVVKDVDKQLQQLPN
ncbi:hypothetical protein DPMN_034042 [Dreissena polymorpha]|uniref:Uncharacterized protein n=1 Tax=Dreissena polymorpha TaxID=45954 RepID=A0A9D4M9G0_DREPO|nr:hypothetical protein DPMN_034042 [Dreissena polymorpha]